jgi:DNA-binding transcriptional regulator YhcF (GntR family)
MAWKFDGERPIYLQTAEIVKQRILKGEYAPGSRIPSVRDMAAEAGVNPNTMQRALAHLEESKILCSHTTAGRFVTEEKELLELLRYQAARRQILDFVKKMNDLGYESEKLPVLIERVVHEENMQS